MKKIITISFSFLFLLLGAQLFAQQWNGSTNVNSNIYRLGSVGIGITLPAQSLHVSGHMRTDGGKLFLKDGGQYLAGNNAATFVMASNHATVSQLLMRNNLEENMGGIIGSGEYFGLRDADSKWVFLSRKGLLTQIRVNSIAALTARLYDDGAGAEVARVGILTSNPLKDFHVNGEARINHLYINTNSDGGFDKEEYFLFVDGKAAFEEVRVQLSQNWGDYVFADDYKPMSLDLLKDYVKTNRHLPNMPKASELEENGMELSDIVTKQMVNIEELVLHTIAQEDKILELENQLKQQSADIILLKNAILKK